MIYEVGFKSKHRCRGEGAATRFCACFVTVMFDVDTGPTLKSYADSFCIAASHKDDVHSLYAVACLYHSRQQYDESAELVRRSLALLEDEGNDK